MTQQRLRVCHVAATTEGATWMLEQLRELRDRFGWEVTAIIQAGEGSLQRKLEAEGIRILTFDFEFPGALRLHGLLGQVLELARLFRRERFDVVQTHLFNSMVLGRLAGWIADVPVRLAMVAGPYHLEAETPRWIDASTAWMETAIIGSCAYTNDLYRRTGIADEKLNLIYYGPDAAFFNPLTVKPADIRAEFGWPATAPVVGMVAFFYPKLPASRWTPRQLHNLANKRHEDLLRAIPAVLRDHPDARFVLVGSGWGEDGDAQFAAVRALAVSLGVSQAVGFTGHRSDVAAILSSFDVAVQASLNENLGGTIEALLMARPLVATRVGGMVDSVENEVTGLLVPPLDPDALARAISRLLADRSTAQALGRAGRERMLGRFTLEQTVLALDTLYRSRLASDTDARRTRHAYRWPVSLVRRCAAVCVFGYLGARLLWDLYALAYLAALRDRIGRLLARRTAPGNHET